MELLFTLASAEAAPVDAVIWDLDNTLFDRDAAFARWIMGLPITPTAAQRRVLQRLDDRGQGDRVALFAWMCMTWPELGEPEALWATMGGALPAFARPVPAMRAALNRWPCCVLTNGSGLLQRAKAAAIGLSDVPLLVSGELGYAKPDPRAFRAALDALGCELATMIGDDPIADIQGAQALGLPTIWLRRRRQWPAHLTPPDRMIDTLEELL